MIHATRRPAIRLLLVAVLVAVGACMDSRASHDGLDVSPEGEAYLWLEDLRSDTALAWAEARTARTRETLGSLPAHDSLLEEIRAARRASRFVPEGDVPPPAVRTGPFANRFRGGVWTRQPVEAFERGEDAWERVLDLDSLSRAEDTRFAFGSVQCLPPEHVRCLLLLTRDGTARTFDLREYDTATGTFVDDGFRLGPAHTSVYWRDANSVYITTHPTGRAEHALVWRRGEPLAEAEVFFEADPRVAPHRGDQGVKLERRGDRLLLLHSRHQYDVEYHLIRDDAPVRLPVPPDVREILFVDGQMVLQLRSAWTPADVTFPPGSLIGIDLEAFLEGSSEFRSIMESDRDLVVDAVWSTRSLVLVRALADIRVRLFEFGHRDGRWERRRLDVPEDGGVEVRQASAESDRYYFAHEGFLRPPTALARTESGEVEVIGRRRPAFPAAPYEVARRHAISDDGTRVPYFIVRREGMPLDGRNPVLVLGYGGNGVSMLPRYLGFYGPTWLSRGGAYVLANVRGGNEYGPEWHDAARRENRQRAFDDFQAVAGDLVDRGVTSPGMIGALGGSNGGILVGISFIQRPDLYGVVWSNNGVLELHRCSQMGIPPVGERGDGQDPEDWAYMQRYSPFHNLAADRPYPPVLLTANRADDIVHPCHSRKFAARMEDLGYEDVFYYETEAGGHGKVGDAAERAMLMSFFLGYLHPEYGRQ